MRRALTAWLDFLIGVISWGAWLAMAFRIFSIVSWPIFLPMKCSILS